MHNDVVKFWNWRVCWSADCRGVKLFILVSEMTNNPDSKAPHCFPDALWAEMDGVDEVIIHNGRPDLEDLIATGYLRKYVLEPTPQQAAKVLLEADTDVRKRLSHSFREALDWLDDPQFALFNALKALAESKDD